MALEFSAGVVIDDEISIRSTSLFLSPLCDFERDALVLELNCLFHATKNRIFFFAARIAGTKLTRKPYTASNPSNYWASQRFACSCDAERFFRKIPSKTGSRQLFDPGLWQFVALTG